MSVFYTHVYYNYNLCDPRSEVAKLGAVVWGDGHVRAIRFEAGLARALENTDLLGKELLPDHMSFLEAMSEPRWVRYLNGFLDTGMSSVQYDEPIEIDEPIASLVERLRNGFV